MRWNIFIAVLIAVTALSIPVLGDASATSPASTRPILTGRDTPAGAMNIFMAAMEGGDFATAADSFNGSERVRQSTAYKLIAQQRLYRDLVGQFGKKEADRVFAEGYLRPWPAHHYVAEDWTYRPDQPTSAFASSIPSGAYIPMMQQGADGIWRQGRILQPPPLRPDFTGMRAQVLAKMQQRDTEERNRFGTAIKNIEAKKYTNTTEVLHTLFPDGSPAEQFRQAQTRQKAANAEQERQLLAAHFDPSTLAGAVGAFLQAQVKHDPVGLASFFYAKDDKDGRLAKANADRIVAGMAFQDAVMKIPGWEKESFNIYFDRPSDGPEWFGDIQMHGDTAVGKSEGNTEMHFLKINGIWKEDISSPYLAAQQAADMERDNAKLEQITNHILSGKYKTDEDVQSAITAAHFLSPQDRSYMGLHNRLHGPE